MKFSSLLFIFVLLAGVASCSGSKSTEKVEESEAGIELSDAEEFVEDEGADEIAEGLEDESLEEEAVESEAPVEEMAAVDGEALESAKSEMAGEQVEISQSEMAEYKVQKSETLMMISFKIYGDYGRWRELASANSDTLSSSFNVKEGMTLKYVKPTEQFRWTPNGNPYLIKVGDTLGIISNDTYGTQKYWKNIWDNNKPLIKDPNKIFAGFTIYTPEIEARTLANE